MSIPDLSKQVWARDVEQAIHDPEHPTGFAGSVNKVSRYVFGDSYTNATNWWVNNVTKPILHTFMDDEEN
jgi:hypothetical protein